MQWITHNKLVYINANIYRTNYKIRRAVQEDYCGICNNKFVEGENDITWCRGKCGENVHTKCFNSSNCSSCHARWVYAQDVKYPNLFKH